MQSHKLSAECWTSAIGIRWQYTAQLAVAWRADRRSEFAMLMSVSESTNLMKSSCTAQWRSDEHGRPSEVGRCCGECSDQPLPSRAIAGPARHLNLKDLKSRLSRLRFAVWQRQRTRACSECSHMRRQTAMRQWQSQTEAQREPAEGERQRLRPWLHSPCGAYSGCGSNSFCSSIMTEGRG